MKKIESDAISLSSECLRRFWQKDLDFVLQYFSDDVMWIGAQHDEFLLDFETTKADLAAAGCGDSSLRFAECRIPRDQLRL